MWLNLSGAFFDSIWKNNLDHLEKAPKGLAIDPPLQMTGKLYSRKVQQDNKLRRNKSRWLERKQVGA